MLASSLVGFLLGLFLQSTPDHTYHKSRSKKPTREEASKMVRRQILRSNLLRADGTEKRQWQSEICPDDHELIGKPYSQRRKEVL